MDTTQLATPPAIPADLTFAQMWRAWRKRRRNIASAKRNVRAKHRACRMFPNEEALRFDLELAQDALDGARTGYTFRSASQTSNHRARLSGGLDGTSLLKANPVRPLLEAAPEPGESDSAL